MKQKSKQTKRTKNKSNAIQVEQPVIEEGI